MVSVDAGSSDSTIKVWRGSTCVQTLMGHAGILEILKHGGPSPWLDKLPK